MLGVVILTTCQSVKELLVTRTTVSLFITGKREERWFPHEFRGELMIRPGNDRTREAEESQLPEKSGRLILAIFLFSSLTFSRPLVLSPRGTRPLARVLLLKLEH
jgi:hypothetical protein